MESVSNQILPPINSDRSRRKRKKKSPSQSQSQSQSQSISLEKWRSDKQQQIYSTKLVHALRHLRITQQQPSSSSSSSSPNGRAVREVADRALAVAARGKTLWSRAILSKAVKLKFRKQKRHRIANHPVSSQTGSNRSRKQRSATVLRLKGKGLPAVQRKAKALGRLVPGCRKQSLPVVLEETTDYIAAMEMQIRAMTAILSAVGSTSTSSPPSGNDGEQSHMLG